MDMHGHGRGQLATRRLGLETARVDWTSLEPEGCRHWRDADDTAVSVELCRVRGLSGVDYASVTLTVLT